MNADKPVSRVRDWLNARISHRHICVHLRSFASFALKILPFLITQPQPDAPRERPGPAHPQPAAKPAATMPFKPSRIDPLNREPPAPFESPRIKPVNPKAAVPSKPSSTDPLNREPPVPPTLPHQDSKAPRKADARRGCPADSSHHNLGVLATWRFAVRRRHQRRMMQPPNAIALRDPRKNRSRNGSGKRRADRPWNPPDPCPTIPR
jgi:hypothetical protein